MNLVPLPSRDRLLDLFDADYEAGTLRWKVRPVSDFKREALQKMWNARYAGKIAGWNRGMHMAVKIDRKYFTLHRILYKMATGVEPDEIDHENGAPLVNSAGNLRSATHQQNMANRKIPSTNSTGFKGVCETRHGRFQAQIGVDMKCVYLGTFDTPEQASAAYSDAAKMYFGEFARAA